MTVFNIRADHPKNNMKGFTIIELMVVILILSCLASMGYANFMHLKRKAYDATALADMRNLADSIIDVILNADDVNFEKMTPDGGVGSEDTLGNARQPVFYLSSGVGLRISQALIDNDLVVNAVFYHTKGTSTGDPSGRKEYSLIVDESTGIVSMP